MKITICSPRPVIQECSLKDINYQIDPYIGCEHYCYYCYALKDAESDWRKEIKIHENLEDQLKAEIATIEPQTIYFGYHTDPYQACEKENLQTRKTLEILLENGFSASILTKSDLVLRDMDILSEMKNVSVSFSVAFNNNIHEIFESNTVSTDKRIEALHILKQVGIKTNALLCPVIPYVSNPISLIKRLSDCCQTIWIYKLSLQEPEEESYKNIQLILDIFFKNQKDRINKVMQDDEHEYWKSLRKELNQWSNKLDADLKIHV